LQGEVLCARDVEIEWNEETACEDRMAARP
jgi:hypothetical protein